MYHNLMMIRGSFIIHGFWTELLQDHILSQYVILPIFRFLDSR